MKKAKQKYENNPGNSTAMHQFYNKVIRLASNTSDELFSRKKPKDDWSKFKTEEEYDDSLKKAVEFSNKFTDTEKKSFDVLIFNKANADGVCCGYLAWKYITSNNKEIKPISMDPDWKKNGISDKILNITQEFENKSVIIMDLNYNKETVEYIKSKSKFLILIDNHYEEEVAKLPYVFITNQTKNVPSHAACAAVSKFFYPNDKVSYVVQAIDNNDAHLYISYLPDPDPIIIAFDVKFTKNQQKKYYLNPTSLFKDIDEFLNDGSSLQHLNFLSVVGNIMSRFAENMKLEVASKATKGILKSKFKEYKVMMLNYAQPGLAKRVGKYLAAQNDVDFSVLWFYDHRRRMFDFTFSTSHKPDVKIDIVSIAREFGGKGGGFKDTAHFQINGNINDIDKIFREKN